MLSDNSVFKSETKLSPLRETFSNLKKIQKKNNAFKFQKKLNMPSSINCNFKKRIRSRMVAELGLFEEVHSYYNPSYIFQFNKEDQTDSSKDSPSRLIENPISRSNIQREKERRKATKAIMDRIPSIKKPNHYLLESRNHRFSPIQELDETNMIERFKSPSNQNLNNKRFPSLTKKTRCVLQKANTQPRKEKSNPKCMPTPSICSKCMERYSITDDKLSN